MAATFVHELRFDRAWNYVGLILAAGMAAGTSVLAVSADSTVMRVFSLGFSVFLVAGIARGLWLLRRRAVMRFTADLEALQWGWVHRPDRQRRLPMKDIVAIDWEPHSDDGGARCLLQGGRTTRLPLVSYEMSGLGLREWVEQNVPHIRHVKGRRTLAKLKKFATKA